MTHKRVLLQPFLRKSALAAEPFRGIPLPMQTARASPLPRDRLPRSSPISPLFLALRALSPHTKSSCSPSTSTTRPTMIGGNAAKRRPEGKQGPELPG